MKLPKPILKIIFQNLFDNIKDDQFQTASFYQYFLNTISLVSKECLDISKTLSYSGFKINNNDIKEYKYINNLLKRGLVFHNGISNWSFGNVYLKNSKITVEIVENWNNSIVVDNDSNAKGISLSEVTLTPDQLNILNTMIDLDRLTIHCFAEKQSKQNIDEFYTQKQLDTIKSFNIKLRDHDKIDKLMVFLKNCSIVDLHGLVVRYQVDDLEVTGNSVTFSKQFEAAYSSLKRLHLKNIYGLFESEYIGLLKYNPQLEDFSIVSLMVTQNQDQSLPMTTLLIDELVQHKTLKYIKISVEEIKEDEYTIEKFLNSNFVVESLECVTSGKNTLKRLGNTIEIRNSNIKYLKVHQSYFSNLDARIFGRWVVPSSIQSLTMNVLYFKGYFDLIEDIKKFHRNITELCFSSIDIKVSLIASAIDGLPLLKCIKHYYSSKSDIDLSPVISSINRHTRIQHVELVAQTKVLVHKVFTEISNSNTTSIYLKFYDKRFEMFDEIILSNTTFTNLEFLIDYNPRAEDVIKSFFEILEKKVNLKSLKFTVGGKFSSNQKKQFINNITNYYQNHKNPLPPHSISFNFKSEDNYNIFEYLVELLEYSNSSVSFYKYILNTISLVSKECLQIGQTLIYNTIKSIDASLTDFQYINHIFQKGYIFSGGLQCRSVYFSTFARDNMLLGIDIIERWNNNSISTTQPLVIPKDYSNNNKNTRRLVNTLKNLSRVDIDIDRKSNKNQLDLIEKELKEMKMLNIQLRDQDKIDRLRIQLNHGKYVDVNSIIVQYNVSELEMVNGHQWDSRRMETVSVNKRIIQLQKTTLKMLTLIISSLTELEYIQVLEYNPLLEFISLSISKVSPSNEKVYPTTMFIKQLIEHKSIKSVNINVLTMEEEFGSIINYLNNNPIVENVFTCVVNSYESTTEMNITNISLVSLYLYSRGIVDGVEAVMYSSWSVCSRLQSLSLPESLTEEYIDLIESIKKYHRNLTELRFHIFDTDVIPLICSVIESLPILHSLIFLKSDLPTFTLNPMESLINYHPSIKHIEFNKQSTPLFFQLIQFNNPILESIHLKIEKYQDITKLHEFVDNTTIKHIEITSSLNSFINILFLILENKSNLVSMVYTYTEKMKSYELEDYKSRLSNYYKTHSNPIPPYNITFYFSCDRLDTFEIYNKVFFHS
ncbi:centrosomal protein [Tieghemostelium lacteum]|uniref:Centrosomal protein n=1 Tax=Tieghemostelium lacteum TaxID=361077 RepID=A0A151ZCB1_TIELA|nr:centrosomal protein [Tieghemostelium lacteum]|eukprot:KYQ91580.1 centrosomal protein [Tieghemostelium lacteum]